MLSLHLRIIKRRYVQRLVFLTIQSHVFYGGPGGFTVVEEAVSIGAGVGHVEVGLATRDKMYSC